MKKFLFQSGVLMLLLGGLVLVVQAASFSVNSTTDAVDVNPGDGVCETVTPGECTLRAAVIEANALAGHDSITLPAGIYTRTITGVNEDAAATGDLDITDNLTIIGAGQATTIIDGAATATSRTLDRVFHIVGDVPLQMSGLTVRNGSSLGTVPVNKGGGILIDAGSLNLTNSKVSGNRSGNGGGIYNDFAGSVTIINSTVSGNTVGAPGGGIWNGGALTIVGSLIEDNQGQGGGGIFNSEGYVELTDTTIRANRATSRFIDAGGGISNSQGSVIIINSTVSGNTSEDDGAGIRNSRAGTLSLTNSTVSGNEAGRHGGGISSFLSSVTITNSTIDGNSAANIFGGSNSIYNQEGTVTLKNTIIASSSAGGDCRSASAGGVITSLGHNLGSDSTCDLTAPSDISSTDPQVGPLAENGGPTKTHALQAGSIAIDAVPGADCTVSTDQRGVPRPQGAACDIGSYEMAELAISVEIDIKPGSESNGVNPRSKGVIPVAVLSSMDFDATQVDFSTVGFGPNEASPFHGGHVENVNADALPDMVFHFKSQNTGIACGNTDATLTGESFDGVSITGTDTVKTVGCK